MNEIPEQPITRIEKYLDAILKNGGGGGGGTFEKFVITLTPTEEDFSGTFDVTWTEISEAYEEGKLIVGHINYSGAMIEVLPTTIFFSDAGVFMVSFEMLNFQSGLYIVITLDETVGNEYYTLLYTMNQYN